MLRRIQQSIRLTLGNTNPYRIREEFKTLNALNPTCELTFKQKTDLNQNQSILRFDLPDTSKCLGHLLGQYVSLSLDHLQRNYIPISAIDEPGVADFMIRRVQKPDIEMSLSNKLLSLNVGDKVTAKGPITQFVYEGYGNFLINQTPKKYRYVGVISHSTSFVTCYTLAERISSYNDTTSLSLLWVHQHEKDIVLLDQFNDFVERKKLNMNILIQNFDKNWVGPVGQITPDHLHKYMPPPSEDTLIIIYGYKSFVSRTKKLCQQYGHKNIIS